jgi:hypothetical protein
MSSDNSFRLSGQNMFACFGFLIMAGIGMFLSYETKLLPPLNVLLTAKRATATLNNHYSERQSTRRGISMTSYTVTYKFAVEGKDYQGVCTMGDTPEKEMDVWYLPSNPGINGMEIRGHAWIDIAIFAVMAIAFFASAGALAFHFKNS